MIHAPLALLMLASTCAAQLRIEVVARTLIAPANAIDSAGLGDAAHDAAGTNPFAPLRLHVSGVWLRGTGWSASTTAAALTGALQVLQRCGLVAGRVELIEVDADSAFHNLAPLASRLLATRIDAPRPLVFFVRDTRNRPAFDAEAYGAENGLQHPELAHTVWITRAVPHAIEAVAHELFHVLANSGTHTEDSANLMYEETAAGRHGLTPSQCATARTEGLRHGLLRP